MKRRPWSPSEVELLRQLYPHKRTVEIAAQLGRTVETVFAKAHKLGLEKTAAYLASDAANRIRPGERRGTATEFKPGQESWNKGRSFVAGGRSAETRFKPGNRPHTWRPIGSLRVRADGYLERKMTDTGYTPRDWVAVHRLVWEAAHGPIPEGYVVGFKGGRKIIVEEEITLDKLELVHRTELMRRNTIHNLPKPLFDTIRTKAVLSRIINRREKDERK